jgi:hypothetical protein
MAKQISVNDYVEHINSTYPKAQYPQIGKIYTFGYLFHQSPSFDRKNVKEIKFYDFYPATFVFDVDVKQHLFHGFNLHIIPPSARSRWIELINTFVTKDKLDPKKFIILKHLFKISSFAMRQYYMRRVKNFREVPVDKWHEMFNMYANTTFGATTAEISAKYLSFLE